MPKVTTQSTFYNLWFILFLVPVYFEEKFKNQTARKGREAVLRCEAKGDMPITIEWKLYNQRVDLKKKSK